MRGHCLAFSPCRTPVKAGAGGVREMMGISGIRLHAALSQPDGSRIVTASGDLDTRGEARVWDAAGSKSLGAPMRDVGPMRCAEFSPDGTRVVTTGSNGSVRL